MTANSTLIAAGGTRRTRAELAHLTTPEPTASWMPIPHHRLVDTLLGNLDRIGAEVVHEDYCTLGKADARIMGTIDLRTAHPRARHGRVPDGAGPARGQ